MKGQVRVNRCYKTVERHNPIGGHRWAEQVPLNKWDVDGPTGHIQSCRSEEKAEEVRAEWQAFYDKFGTGIK